MSGEKNRVRLFGIGNKDMLAFDTGRKMDTMMFARAVIQLQYEKYDGKRQASSLRRQLPISEVP